MGQSLSPFWCICQRLSLSFFSVIEFLPREVLSIWSLVPGPEAKSLEITNLPSFTVSYHYEACMPQLESPCAAAKIWGVTTKTWCSQINKYFKKEERKLFSHITDFWLCSLPSHQWSPKSLRCHCGESQAAPFKCVIFFQSSPLSYELVPLGTGALGGPAGKQLQNLAQDSHSEP